MFGLETELFFNICIFVRLLTHLFLVFFVVIVYVYVGAGSHGYGGWSRGGASSGEAEGPSESVQQAAPRAHQAGQGG